MAVSLNQFRQQLLDNLSYESDLSGCSAVKFVQACRALRIMTATSSTQSQGGLTRFEVQYDVKQLEKMEGQALRFIEVCNARNPSKLLQAAAVPRQFGLERLRRDHLPDTPPTWAPVHGGGGGCDE